MCKNHSPNLPNRFLRILDETLYTIKMKKLLLTYIILVYGITGFTQDLKFNIRDSLVSYQPTPYSQCDSSWNISLNVIIKNENTHIFIYNEDKIESRFLLQNDTIHSTYYYANGSVKRNVLHQWLNGRNLWIWEESYYENGQIESQYNPNLDSVQHLKVFYPNGTLKREMLYFKSGYFSFQREYNPNGTLAVEKELAKFDETKPWGSKTISKNEYDIIGNPKMKINYVNNLPTDTVKYDFENNKEVLESYHSIEFWTFEDFTIIEYLSDEILIVSKNGILHYALVYNYGTKDEYTIFCNGTMNRKKWLIKPKTN